MPPRRDPLIEVIEPEKRDFTVRLNSQGEVRARTQSHLVAEVSGRIIEVADTFREGAYFEAGEVLLRLDPRDYEAALANAQATVAQMEVALAEEEALAQQAANEWNRLNPGEIAPSLVLREPQLKRARANLAAAVAGAARAALNLERTEISVPYRGRILQQNVDLGQYVGVNSVIGSIYSTDSVEIRLPLNSKQLTYVELPEIRRDGAFTGNQLPVTFTSRLSGKLESWKGTIVRSEGALDSASRQLFVVAEVKDPYGPIHDQPMKVGMFVEAEIEGGLLKDVWVLPSETLREGTYVVLVNPDNTIERVRVEPIWTDRENIVLPADTFAGRPRISKTPMNFSVNGMKVAIKGEIETRRRPRGAGGDGQPGAGGAPADATARDTSATSPTTTTETQPAS